MGCTTVIARTRGVTLLELLVTLAISLILYCLFSSQWHEWLVASRVDAIVMRLSRGIEYARHLAIYRGEPIALCGSDNQHDCNGRWSTGYIIKIIASGAIARYYGQLPAGYRLVWKSSLSRNYYLQFTPVGFTDGQQGTFYVCPPKRDSHQARGVVINRSGRLRYLPANVYAACIYSKVL